MEFLPWPSERPWLGAHAPGPLCDWHAVLHLCSMLRDKEAHSPRANGPEIVCRLMKPRLLQETTGKP